MSENPGKLGGAATYAKYGPEHYARMGQKGGKATSEKHGKKHYSKIGRLGGLAKQLSNKKETRDATT